MSEIQNSRTFPLVPLVAAKQVIKICRDFKELRKA